MPQKSRSRRARITSATVLPAAASISTLVGLRISLVNAGSGRAGAARPPESAGSRSPHPSARGDPWSIAALLLPPVPARPRANRSRESCRPARYGHRCSPARCGPARIRRSGEPSDRGRGPRRSGAAPGGPPAPGRYADRRRRPKARDPRSTIPQSQRWPVTTGAPAEPLPCAAESHPRAAVQARRAMAHAGRHRIPNRYGDSCPL